jgi:hypothetical protein
MMGERRIEVASILSRWPPVLFALVVSFVFFAIARLRTELFTTAKEV